MATAEAEAGARFTDETVLQMALAFAIQRERVVAGRCLSSNAERQRWLHERPIWKLAKRLTKRMLPAIAEPCLLSESAALAMYLLSAARESGSSHDLMVNDEFAELIAVLMREIAAAYHAPSLADDHILRDGLEAHIVPACVRQRFGLWAPRIAHDELGAEQFAFERGVAERLSAIVAERTGCILPPTEQHNLVLLVRAAAIRERPTHPQRVLICCPSGMATTQLLVARLKVRFPHLGTFEVVSLRDLTAQRLANADLIISTGRSSCRLPSRSMRFRFTPCSTPTTSIRSATGSPATPTVPASFRSDQEQRTENREQRQNKAKMFFVCPFFR